MPTWIAAAVEWIATTLVEYGVGETVAYAIANIVVAVALYEAGTLLATVPKLSVDRMKEPVKQAVAPRRRYYGRVMASGVFAFLRAKANFLYSVIMIAAHEIDAIEEHWLNDIHVSLDGGDFVESGVQAGGFLGSSYFVADSDSDGGPYKMIQILTRLGLAAQAVYTQLTAVFPGEWTTDHKLNGIFHALLIERAANKDFHFFYPSGPYKYRAVFRGAKVWDPRISGSDPDDPDTHVWTDNGALVVFDYLRHEDGMRLPFVLFENVLEDWINQANICDEDVETQSSATEKRYRLAGGYEFNASPRDVLPQMLEPMGATIKMLADGSVVLRVSRCGVEDPDIVFTDEHVLEYKMRRGLEKAEMRNEIRATFTQAEGGYETQETDPWVNQESIDLNGLQSVTLDLAWCPSHGQARRRQKLEAYRLDPHWFGEITVNAYGLDALASDFVRVQITDLAIDEVFEILPGTFAADIDTGQCRMTIRSFPQAAIDWAAEEEGEVPAVPAISGGPGSTEPENFAVVIQDVGGSLHLTASCDSPGNQMVLQLQYKPAFLLFMWFAMTVEEGGYSGTTSGSVVDTETYDVRGRFVDAGGIPSAWVTVRIVAAAGAFAYRRIISTDQYNYNLADDMTNHGWDGIVPAFAHVSVDAGTYVGSALLTSGSTGSSGPGFDVVALPATSTVLLENTGFIYGHAGDGGMHAADGESGGTALRTAWAMSIDNTGGVIAGGGGGGGGGADAGGGGGGGGRGYDPGSGGLADTGGTNGADGTKLTPGIGGPGTSGGDSGGDGGDLGEDGQDGFGGTGGIGMGGLSGWCTDGNVNITWIANGTRLGALN